MKTVYPFFLSDYKCPPFSHLSNTRIPVCFNIKKNTNYEHQTNWESHPVSPAQPLSFQKALGITFRKLTILQFFAIWIFHLAAMTNAAFENSKWCWCLQRKAPVPWYDWYGRPEAGLAIQNWRMLRQHKAQVQFSPRIPLTSASITYASLILAARLVENYITFHQFDSPARKLNKICLSAAIFVFEYKERWSERAARQSYPEPSYSAAACHNKILRDKHSKQLLWKNDRTVVC